MLKHYDFECAACAHTFDDYVEGVEGKPEQCPACGASDAFKKLPSTWSFPTTIVVDYPGSKRLKAGYVHTHNRPAEKKDSQVSMYNPKSK
jgi:putative FmdB family regulatory protein